jgi:hypothetical protein
VFGGIAGGMHEDWVRMKYVRVFVWKSGVLIGGVSSFFGCSSVRWNSMEFPSRCYSFIRLKVIPFNL